MSGMIRVNFYTGNEPLDFSGNTSYLAEDLIIESCKYLRIGPVARHLFGLWNASESLWYPPNKELKIPNGDIINFYLRLRFRIPNITSLKEKTDSTTLNYFFRQAHNDFLEGRIPELYHGNLRESALGLVATDIICEMIEENVTLEGVKTYKKILIPQILRKNPLSDNFLYEPLRKAVARGLANAKNNSEFVKENYLQGLTELVPDYGTETYSVLIEKTETGKLFEVELVVNPYHPEYPGLRMRLKKCKSDWVHICSIENLCYISMRSDETVEVSRQNGVPQYIQFNDTAQRHSFVSLLDGYYRLSEKWTFNLCRDLPTPSLLKLRAMKCHGPVSVSFAHKKLEEKSIDYQSKDDVDKKHLQGCYIIRECEFTYDVYYVDVWISTKSEGSENISTFKIIKDNEGMFVLKGWNKSFKTIPQLLSYHANENKLNFQLCIPPSEYDESNLLLCRKQKQGFSSLQTRGDCSCSAQCIPHDAIMFSQDVPTMPGRLTVVAQAHLRRSCTDSKAVAVKMLRKETKVTHLKDFLAQCDKMLYWQHDAIVSTIGMILTNPTALVMEWLPLGPLDKYLENRTDVQEVDLIEAAYHLARALWYLDTQQMVHGNIRCHNILVVSHGDSHFKVKLADPGIITYTDADIHWIPRECYDDYSLASKSTLADVYAYGTTVWQIFSRGGKPMPLLTPKQAKEHYKNKLGLCIPSTCQVEMGKLIEECWAKKDDRKQPQSIVRDVNSILYQIYDSRRTHSYAVVDERAMVKVESPEKPPLPSRRPPVKDSSRNILKKIKWPVTAPFRGFNYNSLSQSRSTLNASSANSTTSFLTEDRENEDDTFDEHSHSNSIISICDAFPCEIPLDNHLKEQSSIISFDNLKIDKKIGEGFYGEVLKAEYYNPVLMTSETVAVKRIKAKDTSINLRVKELLAEMKIMKSLCHKNIVKIIGLVEDPETMLVMEYVDKGSLLCLLQSYKNKRKKLENTELSRFSHSMGELDKEKEGWLDDKELLRFALGVAEGMEYLETQNIVHRDLAARNILVGSNDVIKISDFGLAQEIKEHYYKMRTDRNVPIRWYAIEAIVTHKFSHKSDVWSYGIILWEIFSYGDNPQIENVQDAHLYLALSEGLRLGKPPDCPALVYQLMRKCWEEKSHERPAFSEIIVTLHNIIAEICS